MAQIKNGNVTAFNHTHFTTISYSGMINTTTATWGGSTWVSEGDDETTEELNVTHDSLEQSTATIGSLNLYDMFL